MFIFCSWCKKYLGEKAPLYDKIKSYGLCSECAKKYPLKEEKEKPVSKN